MREQLVSGDIAARKAFLADLASQRPQRRAKRQIEEQVADSCRASERHRRGYSYVELLRSNIASDCYEREVGLVLVKLQVIGRAQR